MEKTGFSPQSIRAQDYTEYKLQVVANSGAHCLSESNTIDNRVLGDDIRAIFRFKEIN